MISARISDPDEFQPRSRIRIHDLIAYDELNKPKLVANFFGSL
jgi:hypothetical protein